MHSSRLLLVALLISVFCVVPFALYGPGLDAPMYYDSLGNIERQAALFEREGLSGVVGSFPQRPIPMATLYANYLLWGMQPEYFRVINFFMLSGVAGLVVLLVRLVLDTPPLRNRGKPHEKRTLALLFGVLFLVHPLNLYLTLYIWQRTALMACLFSYGTLAAYLGVRLGHFPHKKSGYMVCLVLFALALFSKENSATLPILLVLAEVAFFGADWKAVLVRAGSYVLILCLLLAALSLLEHPHGKAELQSGILATMGAYYRESGRTFAEVVLTQCRVVFTYLSAILLPLPEKIQLVSPQVISHSLMDPPSTLPAVVGCLVLVLSGVYWLRKMPAVGFGLLFYLINLLPEALMVPQFAFFGYRPVLPMFGVYLIVVACIVMALDAIPTGRWRQWAHAGIAILLVGVALFIGSVTRAKAELWRNPLKFWEETISRFPPPDTQYERATAAHALNYAALEHMRTGNLSEAEAYLREAIALRPTLWHSYNNLGNALGGAGRWDEAVACYKQALERYPGAAGIRRNLDNALRHVRRGTGAEGIQRND